MNLHQIRFVRETARQNFSLTAAAKALFTSQPGISKSIAELEDELGVEIFTRHGKRICGLTAPGRVVLRSAELILQELEGLKNLRNDFAAFDKGTLTIATTHAEARYTLPKIVRNFALKYPDIRISILQGDPSQIADMVIREKADLAIAPTMITKFPGLASMPCYDWEYVVVAPCKHPILELHEVTLKDIARYPLITYDNTLTGRKNIDLAFAEQGITPDIRLDGVDADVIKTYVELEMGIGIIAAMAYDETVDRKLKAHAAGHLFGLQTSHIAAKRGTFLRDYVYYFIELLSPQLNREEMRARLSEKEIVESKATFAFSN